MTTNREQRHSWSPGGAVRRIAFVGPSIDLGEARSLTDAELRPPCRRGDLDDVGAGDVVGIIDGVFDQHLAISPGEIMAAIARGARICGAASMGALRASEVPAMDGLGGVYDMYRHGLIESDDEVAVLVDPERLTPLTVPLVNVRFALSRLENAGTISSSLATAALAAAKHLHYTERTYPLILK